MLNFFTVIRISEFFFASPGFSGGLLLLEVFLRKFTRIDWNSLEFIGQFKQL